MEKIFLEFLLRHLAQNKNMLSKVSKHILKQYSYKYCNIKFSAILSRKLSTSKYTPNLAPECSNTQNTYTNELNQVANYIKNAENTLVLTGAGIRYLFYIHVYYILIYLP